MIFILPNHSIGDFWFWTLKVNSRRCDTESINELQMWVPLQHVTNGSFLLVRLPNPQQLDPQIVEFKFLGPHMGSVGWNGFVNHPQCFIACKTTDPLLKHTDSRNELLGDPW